MKGTMARDIDNLNPLPDSSIEKAGREYLIEHDIDGLLAGLLEKTLKNRPPDVVQYIADCLEFGHERAQQDPTTGLPLRRRKALVQVFKRIDTRSSGSISFEQISSYATAISLEELNEIFIDFTRENRTHITLDQFLMFFGRISMPMNNHRFKELVDEMMA